MPFFTGDTDQLRDFVPVTINFTTDDLMPFLQETADSLLPAFLGYELASQLGELIGVDLSDASRRHERRALHLAQTAIARIGFAAYLPFCEVQIGDNGITVTASEGRKAAFEYQTNKLERNLLEHGWRALDELITLVATQPEVFPDWASSPYFDEYEDASFKTPADFSRYYPIQDRWLTFWALRPFVRSVEADWGEPARERMAALPDSVTENQKKRLERTLLRALAYQSVLEALPNLSIELNGANVQVNYASQFGNAQYYQAPGKDHLTWVMQNLQSQADLAWQTFDNTLGNLTPTATDEASPTGLGMIDFDGPFTLL